MREYLSKYGIEIPDFLSGMGSVLNLYPDHNISPMTDKEALEADARALRSDWQSVGNDFKKFMKL